MKRLLLVLLLSVATSPSRAELPAYTVENGAIRLPGVRPDNRIIYDNDWWFDVFDNNYLWAQASLGHATLRGNSVPAIQQSIGEFHKDADWIRVEKETEAGGKLRSGVTAYKLTPTDFSKLR